MFFKLKIPKKMFNQVLKCVPLRKVSLKQRIMDKLKIYAKTVENSALVSSLLMLRIVLADS